MTPLVVIELAMEVIRLINNLTEGKPPEQRKAEAIIGYNLTWPIIKPLLPASTVEQVEGLMKNIK